MTEPETVFSALSDPTRRRMFDQLIVDGPATATMLAGQLPITRQAVAKHLGVLEAAGLVERQAAGRETRFKAVPDPLVEVQHWIDSVGEQWTDRLNRLRRQVGD